MWHFLNLKIPFLWPKGKLSFLHRRYLTNLFWVIIFLVFYAILKMMLGCFSIAGPSVESCSKINQFIWITPFNSSIIMVILHNESDFYLCPCLCLCLFCQTELHLDSFYLKSFIDQLTGVLFIAESFLLWFWLNNEIWFMTTVKTCNTVLLRTFMFLRGWWHLL